MDHPLGKQVQLKKFQRGAILILAAGLQTILVIVGRRMGLHVAPVIKMCLELNEMLWVKVNSKEDSKTA